jgi:hypothetical protein
MSLVQFKYAIDLYSEYRMGNDVNDVNHEQAVSKICQRKVVVEPVDYTDFVCCEYRNLSQVNNDTNKCAQYKQKIVPHSFELVIVFGKTHGDLFQFLHYVVQL